jgi:hypothetical protein
VVKLLSYSRLSGGSPTELTTRGPGFRKSLIVALMTTQTVLKGSELMGSYGDESFWMVREQTLREREALMERIRTKAHKATQSMLAWAEMDLTKACEA